MSDPHDSDPDASLLDRLSSAVPLRRAERATHILSAVDILLTIIMVGGAAAVEGNLGAAWFIENGGLRAWAVATPLLVAVWFAWLRVVQAHTPRFATIVSWASVTAAASMVGWWTVIIASSGVPSVHWPWLQPAVVGVGVLAVGLAFRWELRSVGEQVSERVPSGGHKVAAVLAVLLVVVSGLGGVSLTSEYSAVDNASATHGISFSYGTSGGGTYLANHSGEDIDLGVAQWDVGGVADIDGDGDRDVAYREDGSGTVKYVDESGTVTSLSVGSQYVAGMGEFGGRVKILYVDGSNNLKSIDKDGDTQTLNTSARDVGFLGDIDGDGSNEVPFSTTSDELAFADPDGTVTIIGGPARYSVGGVGDIDGDGDVDIAHNNPNTGNVHYTDTSNNSVNTGLNNADVGGVGDGDGDGDQDILYADGSNNLKFVDGDSNTYDTTQQAAAVGGFEAAETEETSSSSSEVDQTFVLDDNSGKFPDPTLTVEEYNGEDIQAIDGTSGTAISESDWLTVEETTFNHDDEATVEMDEDNNHRLTLTDGGATYQEIGFKPADKPNPYTITIGTPTPTGTTTATPTANTSTDSACTFVEDDSGDYSLVCNFPDAVTSYDYNLSAGNGTYYEGSLDFDEPTIYYEGIFDENFTSNLTDDTSPEDFEIAWDGIYENGTSFNGSTSLFGASDSGGSLFGGGGGGPTGKPGDASGTQQVIAWSLLAGVGYAGYRRFSDGPTITQAASKAPQAVSKVTKRLPGLRGGK